MPWVAAIMMAHHYVSPADKLARAILKAATQGLSEQPLTLPLIKSWFTQQSPDAIRAAVGHCDSRRVAHGARWWLGAYGGRRDDRQAFAGRQGVSARLATGTPPQFRPPGRYPGRFPRLADGFAPRIGAQSNARACRPSIQPMQHFAGACRDDGAARGGHCNVVPLDGHIVGIAACWHLPEDTLDNAWCRQASDYQNADFSADRSRTFGRHRHDKMRPKPAGGFSQWKIDEGDPVFILHSRLHRASFNDDLVVAWLRN